MSWWAVAAGLLVMFVAVVVLAHRQAKIEAGEWIEQWERAFPGTCPVCGFYRCARRQGHHRGPTPSHQCPETSGDVRHRPRSPP